MLNKSKREKPRYHQFEIMQYDTHPDTGEVLITEEQIKNGLAHNSITRYSYIHHTDDVWTDEDEADNPEHKSGEPKPPHWHTAIECKKNAFEVDTIARWFGVPPQYVNILRGRGAFLDMCEYLVHETTNSLNIKTHYDDDRVVSNFNWRDAIELRRMSKATYGQDMDLKTQLQMDVFHGRKTLREIERAYPVEYMKDVDRLQKNRLLYLYRAPMPSVRHNFYICGEGGVGKDSASIILAHALYPDIKDDQDLFFMVGSDNATFEGYDGQPVIIWSDFRAGELINACGSRGRVLNVFDTHPKRIRQNVKYSSINLINTVNIVNSVQPYREFLTALAGEYEDKYGTQHTAEDTRQTYRRFPFIMPLRTDDFDILINEEYLGYSNDVKNYRGIINIYGNFGRLYRELSGDTTRVNQIGAKMVKPLIDAHSMDKSSEVEPDTDLDAFGTVNDKQISLEDMLSPEDWASSEPKPEPPTLKRLNKWFNSLYDRIRTGKGTITQGEIFDFLDLWSVINSKASDAEKRILEQQKTIINGHLQLMLWEGRG